jgi:hypothetical protein
VQLAAQKPPDHGVRVGGGARVFQACLDSSTRTCSR